MLKKSFIFVGVMLMAWVSPALAQTPCQTIDQLLGTASLIRDIQFDQRDRDFSRNIRNLERLSQNISLSALVPADEADLLSVEKRAIFDYLSIVREAVAGADSGYNDYAKETLAEAISVEFTASSQSLTSFWECGSDPEETQSELEIAAETATRTSGGGPKVDPGEGRSKRSLGQASVATERANSGVRKNMRLDSDILFKGNAFVLMGVLAFIAAIILIRYAQLRAKTFRKREARRLLSKPVKAKLGKDIHDMLIVDISMNGAKIRHPGVITKLSKISLKIDGTWHAGQIQWNNNLFAGISFKKPMAEAAVVNALNG